MLTRAFAFGIFAQWVLKVIKAVICYDVPVGKQDEYLKFMREEFKPFYEANGCRAFNIFREVSRENNKDFVAPDQLMQEIVFDDIPTMDKFRSQFNNEPWKSLLERYHSWHIPGSVIIKHYISEV